MRKSDTCGAGGSHSHIGLQTELETSKMKRSEQFSSCSALLTQFGPVHVEAAAAFTELFPVES